MTLDLSLCEKALQQEDLLPGGHILRVSGQTVEARLPRAQTNSIYRINGRDGREGVLAEVIAFRGDCAVLAPLGEIRAIGPGDPVVPEGLTDVQVVSEECLGRIFNALGQPLDGGPPLTGKHVVPIYRKALNPLQREPIRQVLETGISSIDTMLTCGRGQRIGIFAGAGLGKSTLLGMLARFCEAEVNIVALIGERGREVRAFVEDELGKEGLAKSVVFVATGDEAPILRLRTAFLATAMAEYFRDRGRQVLLVMDSLSRVAYALREIGLAAGEPPTTRGYPPSTFSVLPKLLERAGNARGFGTLTAFYSVLVEGDDMTDPVAVAAQSMLDGHLILSRRLATAGHFPAIDPLGSLSRMAEYLCTVEHRDLARQARQILALRNEMEDLIQVGAYKAGADPKVDLAIKLAPRVSDSFQQDRSEPRSMASAVDGLREILGNHDETDTST
jgi:flagellum-specific ATP synthase